ncbi:hypothetical protein QN386_06895 [Pseudomonas sp. CCI3.2]|uniref:hypothetical protein n=1 Tax=unclassified Pseudomonas TaxID=196821 RepID=UPI002B227581|nr:MULTISPECIES: hypothetical protein [unclassified Pseudomonas]MEB0076308.1 hypothetical protein [Pseudomonas sp. MH10out]MEB0101053.1 hypothetical protein [Pseudomonas sp. CCI3.2]MEB0128912.1 hypothetical protein [Pseudomonas sp. CCI2.4]
MRSPNILFLLLASFAGRAIAVDASSCYAINDADARAYCLAKAHGNPSGCYSILAGDLRSMCLAEVRK